MKEEVKKEVMEVLAEIQGDLITFKEACIRLEQAFERVAKVEEKFVPKDGDFFTWTTGSKCIAIFKEYTNETHAIVSAFLYPNGTIHAIESERCSMNEIRLATESEKQTLLDALAKDGKKWNAELKRIEKLRWRANHGGEYYTVRTLTNGIAEVLCATDGLYSADTKRYEIGNYYRARATAQSECDRINAIFAESI